MAAFEFEGETDNVSARQLEYVSSVLENRGFKGGKVNIEAVGKAGDNYGSMVKRFIYHEDGEAFKMIAKIAPNMAVMRDTVNINYIFLTEVIMYTTVLPKFAELEKEAGIPVKDRLRFATCYGSLMEEPNEIILLEDLNVENFVILDRFKSLTSESVKLVLRSFAMLHSLSYVLKTHEPETFKFYCDKLINMWEFMGTMKDLQLSLVNLENDIIEFLDNADDKRRVKNSLTGFMSKMSKNVKFFKEKHYSVIQQGDAWTNNIMFKLEGENVVECCMIDYQISTENSPVADIIYMLFNCTDHETRSKHYHEWIDYYYTELEKRLYIFGLKVNDFYTRDRLDADLRRQAKAGFGQAIMISSALTREHHEAAEIKLSMEKDNNLQEMFNMKMGAESMKRFKDRVDGLLKSCVELGFM